MRERRGTLARWSSKLTGFEGAQDKSARAKRYVRWEALATNPELVIAVKSAAVAGAALFVLIHV